MKRGIFKKRTTPTPFMTKPRKALKRGGSLKKTKLNVVGHSTVAQQKEEIQRLVRLIVTARDGGCILRNLRCGLEASVDFENEKVISEDVIQADHLVTRANSASYADTRLIVCLCRRCHAWKKWNEKAYDQLVKTVISKDRVELWDKCQDDRNKGTYRMTSYDWKLEIVNLNSELREYK